MIRESKRRRLLNKKVLIATYLKLNPVYSR